MRKPTILLSSLHFRKLLFRPCSAVHPNYLLKPSPSPSLGTFHRTFSSAPSGIPNNRLIYPHHFTLRLFSNTAGITSESSESEGIENNDAILLSIELQKNSDEEPLPLPQRLDLSFSHITITPDLILATLNISPDAGRMALDFLKWVNSRPGFQPNDELYSYFIHYFGRRKDFMATHEILVSGVGVVGDECLKALVDRLARAGRPTQLVALFDKLVEDYGFSRNMDSLKLIVTSLCERGYASYAEKMVKGLASEFFPDEYICDVLIKGWSVDGKLDEAKRLTGEMYRGGFEIGTSAYNAMLDCVCKLCREKDPFRLESEADGILLEMERNGVPRNVETFNILISNLCKIRRTSDAMKLFHRMSEWGCYPDETTFLELIRSLYQAARVGEGDEMIDRMKSAGFGDSLNIKVYYGFLKILCGIERIDHAMSVFAKMKEDKCVLGIKTYELLTKKLYEHGRKEKATALYREAESNGLAIERKEYNVNPRFVKKKVVVEKVKKRETLPEKMARKRRTLKKIRLSFVKKPKNRMRRRM